MNEETFKTESGLNLNLRTIKGKLYMDCTERVRWFRHEKPNWRIHTSLVSADKEGVLFRAVILNEKNEVMSTAHRYQDKSFQNMHEKSESQAIGRALALVGHGTNFCHMDFDSDTDDLSQLSDSPIENPFKDMPATTLPTPDKPELSIIKFGKHKGVSIQNLGFKEAASYADYLVRSATQSGKPLGANAGEFVENVRLWALKQEDDVP